WHWRAYGKLVAYREHLLMGHLDAAVRETLGTIGSAFRALKPPSRPSQAKMHQELVELFEGYTQAAAGAQAASAKAIYAHICVTHEPKRNDKAVGLSARTYPRGDDHDPHPLQFTLLDVNPLLNCSALRNTALQGLSNTHHTHIKNWWRDAYDTYLSLNPRLLLEMTTPVTKKLNRFAMSDVARRMFGQPENTVDLEAIVREGGVLILDLAASEVGGDTAALVGSTVLNWLAAILFQHRASAPRRVFLVVDEFQSIPGADFAQLLSELAKFGVQLCLGTQSLALLNQINPKTRAAWLSNTQTLFVFRCSAEDADALADELSVADKDELTVSPADIVGLPDYACFVRARAAEGQPAVFRCETRLADAGDTTEAQHIVDASRLDMGRDAGAVDAWLHRASRFHGKADLAEMASRTTFYRNPSPGTNEETNDGAKVDNGGDHASDVPPEGDLVSA
ncbi:MAG: type IV secretion system DNA-binding domain-containing protein, partial [Anaerolineae bacterium]|nr:type IV secretion system DNA-binding domain-containing protein [Anaerolineae bacterium]